MPYMCGRSPATRPLASPPDTGPPRDLPPIHLAAARSPTREDGGRRRGDRPATLGAPPGHRGCGTRPDLFRGRAWAIYSLLTDVGYLRECLREQRIRGKGPKMDRPNGKVAPSAITPSTRRPLARVARPSAQDGYARGMRYLVLGTLGIACHRRPQRFRHTTDPVAQAPNRGVAL